jgi:hypothetical protein
VVLLRLGKLPGIDRPVPDGIERRFPAATGAAVYVSTLRCRPVRTAAIDEQAINMISLL